LGRMTPKLRHKHSDEDHLANHSEGVIAMKTTIEIQTCRAPQYAESTELSVLDGDDKIGRSHSR
jgi:hypothetical protein